MTEYILHYAPDNASLAVRLVLEEMGLPYRTILVDRSVQEQCSEAYRALNPSGTIPTLVTPQGPVTETAAILLWLAETQGRMAPLPGAPERADFLSKLFFASNTAQALLRMNFYPEKFVGTDANVQRVLRHSLTKKHPTNMTLPAVMAIFEQYYERQKPLREREVTVLDYLLGCFARWSLLYPAGGPKWFDFSDHPHLLDLTQQLETRAATLAAQKAEGLGPTPFSNPHPANPPEGVPL